jgi:hypothetical protein
VLLPTLHSRVSEAYFRMRHYRHERCLLIGICYWFRKVDVKLSHARFLVCKVGCSRYGVPSEIFGAELKRIISRDRNQSSAPESWSSTIHWADWCCDNALDLYLRLSCLSQSLEINEGMGFRLGHGRFLSDFSNSLLIIQSAVRSYIVQDNSVMR